MNVLWQHCLVMRESDQGICFLWPSSKKKLLGFPFFPSSGFSIELGTSGLNDHIWRTNLTVAIATKVFKTVTGSTMAKCDNLSPFCDKFWSFKIHEKSGNNLWQFTHQKSWKIKTKFLEIVNLGSFHSFNPRFWTEINIPNLLFPHWNIFFFV